MRLRAAALALLLLAPPLAAQEPPAQESAAKEPAAQGAAAEAEPPLDVETILSTPSDEDSYTEEVRCISTTRIRSSEVLDERHIVFRMSQNEYYLVQFERRCPMLQRDSTLVYEVQGSRLCQLDSVRAVNGIGISRQVGPLCLIPGFQPVTKEQVALIKESLKQLRRSKPGDVPAQVPATPEAPAQDGAESPVGATPESEPDAR